MGLIANLLKSKIERKQEAALKYLYNNLKIASYKDMTMQQYFNKSYRANCYYYSTYILLCMKPTDRLVRGKIHLGGDYAFVSRILHEGKKVPNYDHGWIEFEYKGDWFVYDDHYKYPVLLKDYYEKVSPYIIDKKFTQTEFIEYIKEKFSDKITIDINKKITKISTKDIWDNKYYLPLEDTDLIIKDGRIVKATIDRFNNNYYI